MKNTKKDFTEIVSIIVIVAILAMPVVGATLITIAAVQEWGFIGILGKASLLKVLLLWNDYVIARVGYILILISGICVAVFKAARK